MAFTLVFVFIDAALAFLIASTINTNTDLSKIAGWLSFAFAAVGAYIYSRLVLRPYRGPRLSVGSPVLK